MPGKQVVVKLALLDHNMMPPGELLSHCMLLTSNEVEEPLSAVMNRRRVV